LYNYIRENNLQILGNPLPQNTEQEDPNFEAKDEFEFSYDLGLAPEFSVNISSKDKFTLYDIQVDDALLNKNIADLAKRYGSISSVDESSGEDMLQGEFLELDDDGKAKEEGISHTSTIAIEYIDDDQSKALLKGLKLDDKIILNPRKVSKGDADMAGMLGIETKDLPGISNKFQFRVVNIYRMKPAEINQELFDKIFGPGVVSGEEDLRNRVSDEIKKALEEDSNKKLRKDIVESFIAKLKVKLPDDFLKRWLLSTSEKDLTEDQIEKEYDDYSKSLKWQLIENKIIQENNLVVEPEEALDKAKELLGKQLERYGQTEFDDEQLTQTAQRLLKKEEDAKEIYGKLYDVKLMELYRTTFNLKSKEVTYDEFVNLATSKPSKFRLFDNLSNLLNPKNA